jgi:polyisoprenyl-phosphate glycosyltransferase
MRPNNCHLSSANPFAPVLSVVVPCYNEQEVIGECHRRLTGTLSVLDGNYEIVYVNDGSRDRTSELLRAIHFADSHVTTVMLARNFGHQYAVTAGLSVARGQAIIIIDSDLQDPPEIIPRMLELWREGYQVIYGIRMSREGGNQI